MFIMVKESNAMSCYDCIFTSFVQLEPFAIVILRQAGWLFQWITADVGHDAMFQCW